MFDFSQKNNYLHWVQKTVDAERRWHASISDELEAARHLDTTPNDRDAYAGSYTNPEGHFMLAIRVEGEKLIMSFQDRRDEDFELRHYEYDTFC